MFGFFSRIRERARAAVLLGVADAADDILGPDASPADLERDVHHIIAISSCLIN